MSQRYKKISISNFFAPKKQRNHKTACKTELSRIIPIYGDVRS